MGRDGSVSIDRRLRSVRRVVESVRTLEGGGFAVRRPFPTRELEDVDPFLLLDEMGPTDVGPGEAKGAPDHPHRGFETVTYLLSGGMEHRDSRGHAGRIGPGDVQWMTAGDGVVHSEMPSAAILQHGGRMHGFQLWVNLPRRDKRLPPRYQDLLAARVPTQRSPDGKTTVRVIAGESQGARASVETRIPILYLHVTLAPGGRFEQPVDAAWNAFAYVFAGEGSFGRDATRATEGQLVLFERDGAFLAAGTDPSAPRALELLLLAAAPLGEPVARYGPFVMNTQAEILEAIEDFRAGRMGHIDAG
jgi:redox-sensitive bicupin YhaK (pirin superfamily)